MTGCDTLCVCSGYNSRSCNLVDVAQLVYSKNNQCIICLFKVRRFIRFNIACAVRQCVVLLGQSGYMLTDCLLLVPWLLARTVTVNLVIPA